MPDFSIRKPHQASPRAALVSTGAGRATARPTWGLNMGPWPVTTLSLPVGRQPPCQTLLHTTSLAGAITPEPAFSLRTMETIRPLCVRCCEQPDKCRLHSDFHAVAAAQQVGIQALCAEDLLGTDDDHLLAGTRHGHIELAIDALVVEVHEHIELLERVGAE